MLRFATKGFVCALFAPALLLAEVSFNRDVRPILSSTCFACHGPDEKHLSGELQLTSLERALKGGESGEPALVPGDARASRIIQRALSNDPELVMPPPEFHTRLTAEQKQTLVDWVDQGATFEKHWAFSAPKKADVPPVGPSGSENPVDRFIEARLEKEGLQVAERAEFPVLARRLHLDLTGLPPTIEELQLALDADSGSVGALIDRLLASPHYGERMAVDWMDASRYADTHGYSRDGTRHVWLWRDWVLKAFNDNKPYDAFITEQLAGDLLPDATDDQLIASGFNRLHPITQEGGTIPEENLVNYVVDRVKTTSEAMLGMTMACAQCHDHKYDPISQKEYFEFYAFFNALGDKGIDGLEGRNAKPTHTAFSPLRDEAELARLRKERETLAAELNRPLPEAQKAWEDAIAADLKATAEFVTQSLKPVAATSPGTHEPAVFQEGNISRLQGRVSPMQITFEIPVNFGEISGVRLTSLPSAPDRKPCADQKRDFAVKSLSASFSPVFAPSINLNSLERFSRVSATSTQDWNQPPANAFQPTQSWRSASVAGRPESLTGTLKRPVNTGAMRFLVLELIFGNGQPDLIQVEVFRGKDPDPAHPLDIVSAVQKPAGERTVEELAALQDYFKRTSHAKARHRHALANLDARIHFHSSKHETMVMNAAEKPRKTHILNRGVYSDKLEEVQPGTPKIFPPLEADEGTTDRLDLARWFLRDDHPTTSRVAVNRIWSLFFGRGLSESLADFGSQGTYPSHPELLDWLAVDFRESGWDTKRLIRMIVSSRTYQQSSKASPGQLEHDPKNEMLARGPRFRLQAEFVRDVFLRASGLLNPQLGGPSVNPYQPGDLWRQVSHFGSVGDAGQTFVQDRGDRLYRRSLYTFWKRTLPPPNMAAFDAPNREICSIGRMRTNTPLSALVLLNDPQFVEASRFLAEQVLQMDEPPGDRLRFVFRQITSTEPNDEQLQVMQEQLDREIAYFARHPERASSLTTAGDTPVGVAEDRLLELATWTNTVSLVFNLSQTITKY